MAPRVSDEHLEARRQQILDAAERSFSRYGLHDATLERIREEAGLSRGAVYHYFRSKEEIVEAMRRADLAVDETITPTPVAGAAGQSLADFVTAMVERMTGPDSRDGNRVGVMLWAESLVNARLLEGQARVMETGVRPLEAIVAQAQAEGAVTSELRSRDIADFLLATMMGMQIFYEWRRDQPERLARVLDAVLAGRFWTDAAAAAAGH